MIQELLGGGSASLLGGERIISLSGAILQDSTSSSPPSTTPTSTTPSATTTTTSNPAASSEQQNLRCPRCDSPNTKFCYYNNYNLTQPRHFCKTCRRYWTKGGALRNVPIGGGCRKNKTTSSPVAAGKSSAGKVKSGSTDIIKSSLGFDHDQPPSSNPILWASPHNSQLLALLRATQNPNPNPHSVSIKDEGTMIGSHMNSSSEVVTGALNARPVCLDPLSGTQVPIGLCSSSWRNNHQQHHQNQQHHHHNMLLGTEVQNTGIHELYQRLRSSSNYQNDHSQAFMSNFGSTSSASSTILEPSPVAAGADLGYWNPAFSWSNLSTTNGAFP